MIRTMLNFALLLHLDWMSEMPQTRRNLREDLELKDHPSDLGSWFLHGPLSPEGVIHLGTPSVEAGDTSLCHHQDDGAMPEWGMSRVLCDGITSSLGN